MLSKRPWLILGSFFLAGTSSCSRPANSTGGVDGAISSLTMDTFTTGLFTSLDHPSLNGVTVDRQTLAAYSGKETFSSYYKAMAASATHTPIIIDGVVVIQDPKAMIEANRDQFLALGDTFGSIGDYWKHSNTDAAAVTPNQFKNSLRALVAAARGGTALDLVGAQDATESTGTDSISVSNLDDCSTTMSVMKECKDTTNATQPWYNGLCSQVGALNTVTTCTNVAKAGTTTTTGGSEVTSVLPDAPPAGASALPDAPPASPGPTIPCRGHLLGGPYSIQHGCKP